MSLPYSGHPDFVRNFKVAIPRLERRPPSDDPPNQSDASPSGPKTRVPTACLGCRARKVRCNGGQPDCKNCLTSGKTCVYPQGRKDRLTTATEHNQEMINVLRGLKDRVSDEHKQEIEDILERVTDDSHDNATSSKRRRSPYPDELRSDSTFPTAMSVSEGKDTSNESLPLDDELQQTESPSKISSVPWPYQPARNADHNLGDRPTLENSQGSSRDSGETVRQRMAVSAAHYQSEPWSPAPSALAGYLDGEKIDIDYGVAPLEVPAITIAQRLLDCYLSTVQNSFPVLHRVEFQNQFYEYYGSMATTSFPVSERWLTILNLVFAIGARYSHLVEAGWKAHNRDDLVYHSRAHVLGLHGLSLVTNPDLVQVQITALLALYLLSIGHINRAWVAIGISIRSAHALGLHAHNQNRRSAATGEEAVLHTWWGLSCLEEILSTMVGRPSFQTEDPYSISSPVSLRNEQLRDEISPQRLQNLDNHHMLSKSVAYEESPSAASYLRGRAQISAIAQKALVELYSVRSVERPWQNIQQAVLGLSEQLEHCVAILPQGLNFILPDNDGGYPRERMILKFHYIATKILITRPCLCRADSRNALSPGNSDGFNQYMARACVDSAKAFTDLLPDHPEKIFLYRTGAWWSMVHIVRQTLVVLVLEMSFGTVQFQGEEILSCIKKVVRLLRSMKERDPIAERIYDIVYEVLQMLASQMNANISDLVTEDAHIRANLKTPFLTEYLHSAQAGFGGESASSSGTASGYHNLGSGEILSPTFLQGSMNTSRANIPRSKSWVKDLFGNKFDERNPITSDDFLSGIH